MIRSGKTFNFGKWRGFTVGEVARRDPGYIYFCENRLGYRFTPKVKREAEITVNRRRAARARCYSQISYDDFDDGIMSTHFRNNDFY